MGKVQCGEVVQRRRVAVGAVRLTTNKRKRNLAPRTTGAVQRQRFAENLPRLVRVCLIRVFAPDLNDIRAVDQPQDAVLIDLFRAETIRRNFFSVFFQDDKRQSVIRAHLLRPPVNDALGLIHGHR